MSNICLAYGNSRTYTLKVVKLSDGFKHSNVLDIVAERLRRWTANPLGSPRVGSNPIDVVPDVVRKEPMPIEIFLIFGTSNFKSKKRKLQVRCNHINLFFHNAERFLFSFPLSYT